MIALIGANILMAMIGGLFGTLRSFVAEADGKFSKGILNVITGIGLAAMTVEQFAPAAGIWGSFGIGILVGSLSGHTIDALVNLVPSVVPSVVQTFVSGFLGRFGGKPKDE